MYKQKIYSVVSILLCICILFSYIPVHVFAAEHIDGGSDVVETYTFDEHGHQVCNECGGHADEHLESCSLYEEIECTCGLEIHSESCPLYEESFDDIYSVEDDTDIICLCGTIDGVHDNECPLYEVPIIDECTCGLEVHAEECPLYEDVIIDETTCTCGSNDGVHTIDCVLYVENDICSCIDGIHVEGCYLYEEIISCTCNTDTNIHLVDCPLYEEPTTPCTCNQEVHTIDCPLYETPVNECTCGAEADIHLSDCPLYKEVVEEAVCNCDNVDGIHLETCPLYVEIDEVINQCICESTENGHSIECPMYVGPIIECTCNTESDIHSIECPLYEEVVVTCTCSTETDIHSNGCPLYEGEPPLEEVNVGTVYEKLMNSETLNEFWDIMMSEENREIVLAFTFEEITELNKKVNILYDCIEVPTSDDEEVKNMLLETLSILPAMECPECGEYGGHTDDCVNNVENLISNPLDGMTLTADASIGAQKLNYGNTITWTIPSGITLTINGTILLQNDTKLVITGGGTIRRNTSSTLFDIEDTCTLNLDGVVVDGENKTFTYPAIQTTADNKVSTIIINDTTFKDMTINAGTGRGVITIFCNSKKVGSNVKLSISDSVFDNCSALTGAAVHFQDNVKGIVTITNTIFQNNKTSQGGVIRSSGSSGIALTLNQCVFKNNIAEDTLFSNIASYTNGAAIYWNACGDDLDGNRASITIIDCQFIGNEVIYSGSSVEDGCGGAIYNEAFMTITTDYTSSDFVLTETTPGNIRGNLIAENKSSNMGGGIMVPTYSGGMDAHNGYGATLTLDNSVFIINNESNKGGGIAMSVGQGSVGDNGSSGSVEYIIICDGAVIRGNHAVEMGGGIYLERESGKDYYPSTIDILSGVISENSAPKGGAICVFNASGAPSSLKNEVNIGSTNGSLTISNNVTTNNGDGGAVYISYGNVNMLSGELTFNEANNGGAIIVENGQFFMAGGSISNNISTNNGGAVYVSNGNFTMQGGDLCNNTSIDGGAVYISGGQVDIYNGVFDGNRASRNGGAIYVNTDSVDVTINIYDGSIINNKADNHGGAIGANASGVYGITLNIGDKECKGNNLSKHEDYTCPVIKNNTSSKLGGAFCLHGNSEVLLVNIYCGNVSGNLAIRYPGSNTINQEGGKFTIYGGQIDPGVMVGGGIFEDNRTESTTVKVRFWGNYDGAPTEPVIIEATLGITLNFPANTYVNGSHELSGWTNIPNSQAGWVPVGGQYAVYQDEDEYLDYYAVWDAVVSYIVYIPESCDIEDNGIGEVYLSAITSYFKKDSNLQVFINDDFTLVNVENSSDILYYEVRTTEPGVNGVLKNNDLVASWQYNNLIDKILTLTIMDSFTSGNYNGTITFNVVYSE